MSADPQALEAEVSQLHREAQDDSKNDARRRVVADRLSELRQLYKRNPAAFSTEVLGMLREIAGAVAVPAGGSRPEPAQPPEEVLKDVFGYDSFRPGQREIIDAVLSGQDCVGVMPTGSGRAWGGSSIPRRSIARWMMMWPPIAAIGLAVAR